MMDGIRLALALLLFCVGAYLVWDLFSTGFNVVVLAASLACFILAHYIKPNTKDSHDTSLVDVLDLIIDIPFRTISVLLRAVGRPFKNDISDVDL
jgi:hypothetical protein